MPKRQNRLKAIAHEERQLDMLKSLQPNATPEPLRSVSDLLLDITQVCLDNVYSLEKHGDLNRGDFTGFTSRCSG